MQRIDTTEKKIMVAIVSVVIIVVFIQAVILFAVNQIVPFDEIQHEESSEIALKALEFRGTSYSIRYGCITLCGNLCFAGALVLGFCLIKKKTVFRLRTIVVSFLIMAAGAILAAAPFALLDSQWKSEYYKPVYLMGVYVVSAFLVLILMNFISERRTHKPSKESL